MTIQELINLLETVADKSMPVCIGDSDIEIVALDKAEDSNEEYPYHNKMVCYLDLYAAFLDQKDGNLSNTAVLYTNPEIVDVTGSIKPNVKVVKGVF